jgi:putative DNA primase/helicase
LTFEVRPNGSRLWRYRYRMGRAGGFRDRLTWRTLYLSTGEKSLLQLCAEGGTRLQGGAEARLLEVPAEVERGTVFEALHGRKNGAALADDLRAAATLHYGHAFAAFLARLTEPRGTGLALEYFEAAGAALGALGDHASGQARRGVLRFALIAAGGELASAWGLTGGARARRRGPR